MKQPATTRSFLALLLALTLTLLAGPAMADEWTDANGDKWTYTVSNGVATITGHTGPGGDVTIPTTVDNGSGASYTVTQIGNAAFRTNTTLTKVTIPSSVTTIGDYAFELCTKLKDVTIPDGSKLTSIGRSAFLACYVLESVMIPQGVTSIATETFHRCSSLKSVTIPDGSKLTSIGSSAFRGCTYLKDVTIPEGVTSIGSNAFRDCTSLESVTIPEGVTSIERQVFQGCSSLKDVTIPEGVTSIGTQTFQGCSSLKDVTIPDGSKLKTIADQVFQGCTSLTSVTIPEGVTSIGNNTFQGCSSLESVTIPGSVTKIDDAAFKDSGLKTIDFGGTEAGWDAVKKGAEAIPIGVTMNYKGWLVTLDANGGTLSQTTVRTDEDGKVVSFPTPARTGHTFKGWLDAREGKLCLSGAIFTSPTTLEAQWEAGVPATQISLNKTTLTLAAGSSETLSATLEPTGATGHVTWSSSAPRVASVSAAGEVTAHSAGTATITATVNTLTATCAVTVSAARVPATKVSLNKTSLTLLEGDTETLVAILTPTGATDVPTWTSDNEAVATVSSSGEVTAVSAGTATVTATVNGQTATCAVTVSATRVPVQSLALNHTRLSLAIGGSETLTATPTPSNATDTVNWSSSAPAVAEVSAAGEVTALAPGTAVIIAAAGGQAAICTVTVSAVRVPATGITLSPAQLNLVVGGSETLGAILAPPNATDVPTWTSDAPSIADVSSGGQVTAISAGNATITATVNGHTATCAVTVSAMRVPATDITLSKTSMTLTAGGSETLGFILTPTNATDSVNWTSDNEAVASVSSTGEVTAFAAGTATITAEVNGYTATCVVTVSAAGGTAYNVTVSAGTGGMALASPSSAPQGTTVYLLALPNAGYKFKEWTSPDGVTFASAASVSTTFAMPDKPVTVTANFEADSGGGGGSGGGGSGGGGGASGTAYNVAVSAGTGGAALASPSSAPQGTTVYLLASPNAGYKFKEWSSPSGVTFGDATNVSTTFIMPAGDATVTAIFELDGGDPVNPPDVDPDVAITTEAQVLSNDGRTVVLRILFDGAPVANTRFWFWLELLSLNESVQTAAEPQAWIFYGPFEGTADAEGRLHIDAEALYWEAGPYQGERAVLPGGEYRIHYADADTQRRYVGATEELIGLSGARDADRSGGGCDSAGLGALTLLGGAALLRRKR